MRLHDLTEEERLALGGIIRLVVGLDGQFSAQESTRIDQLSEYYGAGAADLLWNAISSSSQTHKSDGAIYEAAAAVRRQAARELMIGIADRLAEADQVTAPEHELLLRLRSLWSHADGGGPYRAG